MTFTKENIENLKLVCEQIISLTNESVDGSLMYIQMMCLGDRIKDFGKNPIVKNSGILLLNESPISDIDVKVEDSYTYKISIEGTGTRDEIIQELQEISKGIENETVVTLDGAEWESQLTTKINAE